MKRTRSMNLPDLFGSIPTEAVGRVADESIKTARIAEAIEISKALETPGGILILKYLNEIFEGLKFSPEDFLDKDRRANPDHLLDVCGQRLAIQVIINWLESQVKIVERAAKENETQKNSESSV